MIGSLETATPRCPNISVSLSNNQRFRDKGIRGIHPFIFLWEIVFHVFKLPITIKCRKLGSTACAHTFLVVLQKENSYTAASILIKKYLLRDNSPIEMQALNQTIQFLKLLLDDKLNIFLRSHVGSVFL